jgi:flavin reductase (DIM6/NTAB) family NADH-FMN oxidoreductase RutF
MSPQWQHLKAKRFYARELSENEESLQKDSRWPAMFPSSMCLVTTQDGSVSALEKVVAPVIVNRFPYVMTLSFCTKHLSGRHHVRGEFMKHLEKGGSVAVQFIQPGEALNKVMDTIDAVKDENTDQRIKATRLSIRQGVSNNAPVFNDAYLVYEAKLIEPSKDYIGDSIYHQPFQDIGSHRIYFLEVTAIQLRQDIAEGKSQIAWESLPVWQPKYELPRPKRMHSDVSDPDKYKKLYNPHYKFPAKNTIAFNYDTIEKGMAVKKLSTQIISGNDDSRWPCFFPSSVGMVTSLREDGTPNLMPCGSTAVVGRHPFIIGICVAYAQINERYKKRSSLDMIKQTGKFGCGVPYVDDKIVEGITYAGNRSLSEDKYKITNAGLVVDSSFDVPVLPDLPITFVCKVVGEVKLGTHLLMLGEVVRILVRDDVSPDNPLTWFPWADVIS